MNTWRGNRLRARPGRRRFTAVVCRGSSRVRGRLHARRPDGPRPRPRPRRPRPRRGARRAGRGGDPPEAGARRRRSHLRRTAAQAPERPPRRRRRPDLLPAERPSRRGFRGLRPDRPRGSRDGLDRRRSRGLARDRRCASSTRPSTRWRRAASGSRGLSAAFGPSIARDRYEVGPEVVAALLAAYGSAPEGALAAGASGKAFVDVAAFNERALRARGLDPARIHAPRGLQRRRRGPSVLAARRAGRGTHPDRGRPPPVLIRFAGPRSSGGLDAPNRPDPRLRVLLPRVRRNASRGRRVRA